MISTTVTMAKAHLSSLLHQVQQGESVLILHRGRPVARIVPIRAADEAAEPMRLRDLEAAGIVKRAAEVPDPSLIDTPVPPLSTPAGLLEALLRERQEGR